MAAGDSGPSIFWMKACVKGLTSRHLEIDYRIWKNEGRTQQVGRPLGHRRKSHKTVGKFQHRLRSRGDHPPEPILFASTPTRNSICTKVADCGTWHRLVFRIHRAGIEKQFWHSRTSMARMCRTTGEHSRRMPPTAVLFVRRSSHVAERAAACL